MSKKTGTQIDPQTTGLLKRFMDYILRINMKYIIYMKCG